MLKNQKGALANVLNCINNNAIDLSKIESLPIIGEPWHYQFYIEVLYKSELDYEKMLGRLDIKAEDFLMIGNSLKSDVLPIINIGGYGIHVPYATTWEYEKIDFEIEHENFLALTNIKDVLNIL